MSRAFVTESDGWFYCRSHQQSCLYADERGQCVLPACKIDQEWLAAHPQPGTPRAGAGTPS
jgi:hypothetical protein